MLKYAIVGLLSIKRLSLIMKLNYYCKSSNRERMKSISLLRGKETQRWSRKGVTHNGRGRESVNWSDQGQE